MAKTVNKDYLRFYRLKKGLFQSELKKLINYPDIGKVLDIGKIERGEITLSNDNTTNKVIIKRLAKALGIITEKLFCLEDKAVAENILNENKYAAKNLKAIHCKQSCSQKEVGMKFGYPEKTAAQIISAFEAGQLMLPPEELHGIAEILFPVKVGSCFVKKRDDFLTRELNAAEVVYSCENESKDVAIENNGGKIEKSEYDLHLTDGSIITVKSTGYGCVSSDFQYARERDMLEFSLLDNSTVSIRRRDIFYIVRRGDEE